MYTIKVTTTGPEVLFDITGQIVKLIHSNNIEAGAVLIYCPHTTAGLTINEGADPDVCHDILAHLQIMVPNSAYFHHVEGNSDAHIKASLLGSSVLVIVKHGQLQLGTWQRIFLGEFDGPRTRTLWVSFLS